MPRLVAHSLWCATLILVLYGLAVQLAQPVIYRAPSQYLNNRMFIERYLYGAPARTVLTGSSLVRRIPQDALAPGMANIGLSAGNAATGLAIVLGSRERPGRVLFEINKIDLGLDRRMVDGVFGWPLHDLRKHVLALRLTYQPMSVFMNLLRGRREEAEVRVSPETLRRGVARNRGFSSIAMPPDLLAERIAQIRVMAEQARGRNMQVVFYEMPIAPELQNLTRPSQIRAAMRAAFPPSRWCWLDLSLPRGARTLDGLHLVEPDARAIAAQLGAEPGCNRP
jgi:hypothetical protein